MNPKEIEDFALTALGWGDIIRLRAYAERGLYVSGKLTRRDHHYVHENTVSFDLEVCDMDSFTDEEQAEIEKVANEVEERVQEEVRTTSKKIYRALEREWDWRLSDETIDEDIRANDYDFDENGERDDDGGFKFDQLDDHAKEKAREWMRQGHYEDPDTWWADHIIDEWKEELDKMGFPDADISWSGFSSQGDGASFTSSGFDLDKFANFFMSGYAEQRGHPYSDEKYEGQPGPMRESEDFDIASFTRDAVFTDFSALATYDPKHESHNNPGEKHYMTSEISREGNAFIRLNIFDGTIRRGKGKVRVELYAQIRSGQVMASDAGVVNRKVTFYVPEDTKSKLVSVLLDYWNNARGVIQRPITKEGQTKQIANSLAYRLSMLANLWKKEVIDKYNAELDAQAKAFMDAMTPEQKAALEKRREEWIAKHPLPSPEKLELRAAMKKWKAERDAAAQAVPPPPQQESEEDDFLKQMGGVAARGAVNNLGAIMPEQPVRYMSGARQYELSKTTPDWQWGITVYATVYDEALPSQPWSAEIAVKDKQSGRSYRCDKLIVTPDEKNMFGIQMQKLIPKVEDIAERSWAGEHQLLRELEIAFNSTLGERQSARPRKLSTFYEY